MQISDIVFIDATGYHYSDYTVFLAQLVTQYQTIYGSDTYLESDSQDGQLLSIFAQANYDTAALGAATYNSFSPSTAQGVGLSRVVKINGLTRDDPSLSTVDVVCTGQSGTVLTNCIAIDALNQQWLIPNGTTIPPSTTITVTAIASEEGAIMAQANTITGIFTPTLGWLTVNNPGAAVPGAAVESDATLRGRQAVSTANPSLTVFEGTIGAVENVTGVLEVRGYENDTSTTDANSISSHSISMVVLGGDAVAIATAINVHKGPGCGTYGTTSETVLDSKGMPTTINFYRPTPIDIKVAVSITSLANYTSSYATLIKQEVAAAINAIGIGNAVLITKIYIPANLSDNPIAGATFDITALTIAKGMGSPGTSNIAIAFNEMPTCDPTVDVTVTVT